MRRSTLVTVAVLGGLVCAIGGTGLFAALQDSARSGTNSVESAPLAASADIQVATATQSGGITCGTFSEDLTTTFFAITGATPGTVSSRAFYCLRNVGSQQVTLSALSDALTDVDFACTGDEELHGDTTCGSDGTGELSSLLAVIYEKFDCQTVNGTGGGSGLLSNNATTPISLGTIAAGETQCFSATVSYPGSHPSAAVQKGQSDRVTWRYRWVAQA